MSKHKSQKNIKQSAAALRVNGLKLFQSGNYDKAIVAWENIPASLRPAAALAEAYFRRGLSRQSRPDPTPQAALPDLRRAVQYQPDDACYQYHLGLAAHKAGELAEAVQAYRGARKAGGAFAQRAAYPLALARLQQGEDPASDPAWVNLTPNERGMLQNAVVFRQRPYRIKPEAPRLLQALAALDVGDGPAAQAGLQEALAVAQTPLEKGLAHYYRGVLAAQNENWDEALQEWNAAYAVGLRTSRLQENLAELYHRLAEQLLVEGDIQTALQAAQEAARYGSEGKALNELLAQIHQQLAHQAVSADRWKDAQQHWRAAIQREESSFRLAYNLALAYERDQDYIAAAQAWREALRRRPRRSDHPDALTDVQVARLWQRAAECYHRAGDHEEANHVYQQAIKWSPEDISLRMALAESLLNEGRLVAVRNELERLLDRAPNHVPALLRMGEAYFRNDDEQWWIRTQAKKFWDKAYSLEPNNPRVRQAMNEWYLDRAEVAYSWDRYAEAIENYQKALEFQPDQPQTLSYIAECYINLRDEKKGRQYVEQALAQAASIDAFAAIIGVWLRLRRHEQAWEVLLLAETRLEKIPTEFYVSIAHDLLAENCKQIALRWLQRAIEKAAPNEAVLVMIGEMALQVDTKLAREYLQRAIEAGQMPGQARLLLGVLETREGNEHSSKKYFAEAERIARQTHDKELQERIEMARMLMGGPLAFIERLMKDVDPQTVMDFLDDLENQFDEDEF